MRIKLAAAIANMDIDKQELAKTLGISANTVSNWCYGVGSPSIEQMRVISELSGIPIEYIFLPRELR